MSNEMKKELINPYTTNSPEWLLFDNIKSAELLAEAYSKDIDNYTGKYKAARERADSFRKCLETIKKFSK